jgi:hypothetical protein
LLRKKYVQASDLALQATEPGLDLANVLAGLPLGVEHSLDHLLQEVQADIGRRISPGARYLVSRIVAVLRVWKTG